MISDTIEFPCLEASRCYLTEKELGMRLTVCKTVLPKAPKGKLRSPPDDGGCDDEGLPVADNAAATRRDSLFKFGSQAPKAGSPNNSNRRINYDIITNSHEQPYHVAFDKGRRACDEWYAHLDTEFNVTRHDDGGKGRTSFGSGNVQAPRRVLQLRHCETGEYLYSDEEGRVGVTATASPSTYWYIEPAVVTFTSSSTSSSPMSNTSSPQRPSMIRSRSVSSSSSVSDIMHQSNRQGFIPSASADLQVVLISKEHFPRRLTYTTKSVATILDPNPGTLKTTGSGDGSFSVNNNNNNNNNDPAGRTRVLMTTTNPRAEPAVWELEFTSGELCFISNPVIHCQLRCNLMGQLSLGTHFQGWEVFRFIEVGGAGIDGNGNVAISSWTHSHKFLSSNSDGEVYTVERRNQNNRLGQSEHWRLIPSPSQNGVLLQNVASNRYLSVGRLDQEALWTTTRPNDYAVWHLDAAHSHVYYVTSLCGPSPSASTAAASLPLTPTNVGQGDGNSDGTNERRRSSLFAKSTKSHSPANGTAREGSAELHVSSSKRGPFMTPNRRKWEEWKMERRPHDGLVTFFSTAHEKYLGCNSTGGVHTTTSKGPWCLWEMEESPTQRGVLLRSREHQRLLAVDDDGNLCTADESQGLYGDGVGNTGSLRVSWRLDPRLPPSMTAGKIAVMSAIGLVGVAVTVAMPFAVLGAVEAVGATVTEIAMLGGISAEALVGAGAGAVIGVGMVGTLVSSPSKSSPSSSSSSPSPPSLSPSADGNNMDDAVLCTTNVDAVLAGEYVANSQRPISAWRLWVTNSTPPPQHPST